MTFTVRLALRQPSQTHRSVNNGSPSPKGDARFFSRLDYYLHVSRLGRNYATRFPVPHLFTQRAEGPSVAIEGQSFTAPRLLAHLTQFPPEGVELVWFFSFPNRGR